MRVKIPEPGKTYIRQEKDWSEIIQMVDKTNIILIRNHYGKIVNEKLEANTPLWWFTNNFYTISSYDINEQFNKWLNG